MRMWLCLSLVILAGASFAFADPDPTRFIIVLPPLSIGSPTTGNLVIIPGTSGIVFPGTIITSRPIISSRPIVVAPSGYFVVQFKSGNWSIVWCEPLKTNVVILGRPYVRPIQPVPWVVSPYYIDPSITLGMPYIWHSPLLQPGVLVFRLRHRSAEEVAKLLNDARVVPDGQFVGMGNILIVSAPSLATSGVQQSRIRDLIAAIDQPTEKSTSAAPLRSQVQWRVEVYRTHATTCASQDKLPADRTALLKLSGYECAHKIGETVWNPTSQGDVIVKGEKVDLRLQAKKLAEGWQFALKGQFNGQKVELDGQAPDTSQPILLVTPVGDGKEGLVILLVSNP